MLNLNVYNLWDILFNEHTKDQYWLQIQANITFDLTMKKALFSGQTKNALLNHLLLLARYFIYKNKFSSNYISLETFVCYVKRKYQNEKYDFNNTPKTRLFQRKIVSLKYFATLQTSLCKSTNHMIVNGRLSNDKDGNFTFCSERGLSVTDYLLTNIFDIDSLKNFKVLDWNNFSDHAPLHFSFFKKKHVTITDNETQPNKEQKLVFDEQTTNEFLT